VVFEDAAGSLCLSEEESVQRHWLAESLEQLILWLFRVFCEEVFTTEPPSSQRSENFLTTGFLLATSAVPRKNRRPPFDQAQSLILTP
jgi:hypothetical protein